MKKYLCEKVEKEKIMNKKRGWEENSGLRRGVSETLQIM